MNNERKSRDRDREKEKEKNIQDKTKQLVVNITTFSVVFLVAKWFASGETKK